MNDLVFKSYALCGGALADGPSDRGQISGSAAAIGNLDRGGDVLMPGAFEPALAQFRKSGFVALGHDWAGLPIAMPLAIEERGGALWTQAEFHSHPLAQQCRRTCQERLDQGLDVGLSVGFTLEKSGAKTYANGAALLADAETKGVDLNQVDSTAIQARTRPCRAIYQIAELFEYSLVAAPMNPKALAQTVKGETVASEDPASDLERIRGQTLALRARFLLLALDSFIPADSQYARQTPNPPRRGRLQRSPGR